MKILIIGKGKMGTLYYDLFKKMNGYEVSITNHISENELRNAQNGIRAIVICTPYSFHYHYASMALKNKIHVFVEKPICYSSAEAMQLIKLAEAADLVLFTGQVLRYCEPVRMAKRLLEAEPNEISHIGIVRMTTKKSIKKWWQEQPRFLLLFEGIHSLDLIHYWISPTISLTDSSLYYHDKRFIGDTGFAITLTTTTGITILVKHEMVEENAINEIRLYGSRYDLTITDYAVLKKNNAVLFAGPTEEVLLAAYTKELEEFVKALQHEPAEICTGARVLPALKLIEDVYTNHAHSF